MKDIDSQQVIATHKVGFKNTLEITDKGIRDRSLTIPYDLIRECNCLRNWHGVIDRCGVKYIDQSGSERHAEFGGRAIDLFSDIMRTSSRYGHKISPRPGRTIIQMANELRHHGVESEYVEPEVEHNEQGDRSWQLELGSLKLKGSNTDTVRLTEQGQCEENYASTPAGPGVSFPKVIIQYSVDYIIQIQNIPDTTCIGCPKSKFPRRVVNYHWEGANLAENLNEDTQLRKMLVKAKAPVLAGGCLEISG